MKLLLAILTVIVLSGCARTTIQTPIGMYTSTRDSELDELHIEIIETPDGKTTIVDVNGASGRASSVIDSQTEFFRTMMEAAFAAGRAAGG